MHVTWTDGQLDDIPWCCKELRELYNYAGIEFKKDKGAYIQIPVGADDHFIGKAKCCPFCGEEITTEVKGEVKKVEV